MFKTLESLLNVQNTRDPYFIIYNTPGDPAMYYIPGPLLFSASRLS